MTDEERRRKISSVVEDLQEGGESVAYAIDDLIKLVLELARTETREQIRKARVFLPLDDQELEDME